MKKKRKQGYVNQRDVAKPPPYGHRAIGINSTNSTDTALNQTQLAKRLGITRAAIRKAKIKGEEDFTRWTKAHDPDGMAWEYGVDKKYHPCKA